MPVGEHFTAGKHLDHDFVFLVGFLILLNFQYDTYFTNEISKMKKIFTSTTISYARILLVFNYLILLNLCSRDLLQD